MHLKVRLAQRVVDDYPIIKSITLCNVSAKPELYRKVV